MQASLISPLSLALFGLWSTAALLAPTVAAAHEGRALYAQLMPDLDSLQQHYGRSCEAGQVQACVEHYELEVVRSGLSGLARACDRGEVNACRDLGIAVGTIVTGSRCAAGLGRACDVLQAVDPLLPACEAGEGAACERMEQLLLADVEVRPRPTQPCPSTQRAPGWHAAQQAG